MTEKKPSLSDPLEWQDLMDVAESDDWLWRALDEFALRLGRLARCTQCGELYDHGDMHTVDQCVYCHEKEVKHAG